MPRRQKPPGYEKWTWDEINAGRKMSKGEKRARNLAVSLGASKDDSGRIQPPAYSDSPEYYWIFVGLTIVGVIIAFVSAVNK